MKIFIDFDDVLFNMKSFKRDLIAVFRRHGISRQEFDNSYYAFSKRAESEGKIYDPKHQIKVLRKRFDIDNQALEKDLNEFMKDLSGYVFPDVKDFLGSFSRNDLFLVTYGHVRFQRKKIRNTRMNKCFRRILVSRGDKIDIILEACEKYGFSPKNEDIIFIEDHPQQVEKAGEKKRGIKTFHICRPQGRYSNLLCIDKDYEAKNLKEVGRIIKSEKFR